jgi:phenylacetate-CoA ligase
LEEKLNSLPRKLKDVPKLQLELKKRPESYWEARGRKMSIKLFQDMAERVPAYKDFLQKNRFNPKLVKTVEDFKNIPLINKDNYLRQYPKEMLYWDGIFAERNWVISTSSGSTGEPFYFPRNDQQISQYALTAELYLRENFNIQNKTTLYVDAFAMGAWIGGLFTYEALKQIADKGYSISVITPGIHKQEVINSVVNLGESFDQVIIGCYPPMMKDILDLGVEQGVDWKKYNLGLIFSAEGFGESFRDHVHTTAGIENKYLGSLNHYGTVDQGTLGHETPLTTLIREEIQKNSEIFHGLFGPDRKQPTLVQVLPELFYFESVEGRLICSSNSGIPLVRYDLKDMGGILTNRQVEKVFKDFNVDFEKLLEHRQIKEHRWNLPFVYVKEREDFSVKLAGGMIYPEEIRKALLKDDFPQRLTGKFTMEVVNDKKMQPRLVVHVELRNNPIADKSLSRKIQKNIVEILLAENSEYMSNYKYFGRKIWPKIILWTYEHPLHFSSGGKHKWVKKAS